MGEIANDKEFEAYDWNDDVFISESDTGSNDFKSVMGDDITWDDVKAYLLNKINCPNKI